MYKSQHYNGKFALTYYTLQYFHIHLIQYYRKRKGQKLEITFNLKFKYYYCKQIHYLEITLLSYFTVKTSLQYEIIECFISPLHYRYCK